MMELVHQLVKIRVRPYYIYQCDLSQGLAHFRTSVKKGVEIIEALIGHTSGFCVPSFVVDAPAGGGKIRVMPNYMVSMSDHTVILRNYEGVIVAYHEPEDVESDVDDSEYRDKYKFSGVAKLFTDKTISIEPAQLERHERIKKWKEERKG